MKAVVKLLGKQYLISEGDEITSDKIDEKNGSKIKIEEVLLFLNDKEVKVGKPLIKNAYVEAEILETKKGKKIKVIKFKAKKRYQRKKGHRQIQTKLRINKIEVK